MKATQEDLRMLASRILNYDRRNYRSSFRDGVTESRLRRWLSLGLVENTQPDTNYFAHYKPTNLGIESVKHLLAWNGLRMAIKAYLEKEYELAIKRQIEQVEQELLAIGVNSFERVYLFAIGDHFQIEFPIYLRVHTSMDSGMYVADIYRSGSSKQDGIDLTALSAEAQQAQIACDYLNSKLAGERGNKEAGE